MAPWWKGMRRLWFWWWWWVLVWRKRDERTLFRSCYDDTPTSQSTTITTIATTTHFTTHYSTYSLSSLPPLSLRSLLSPFASPIAARAIGPFRASLLFLFF